MKNTDTQNTDTQNKTTAALDEAEAKRAKRNAYARAYYAAHKDQLKAAVKKFSAGDTTEVELYRAGESMVVTITFDEAKPESA